MKRSVVGAVLVLGLAALSGCGASPRPVAAAPARALFAAPSPNVAPPTDCDMAMAARPAPAQAAKPAASTSLNLKPISTVSDRRRERIFTFTN